MVKITPKKVSSFFKAITPYFFIGMLFLLSLGLIWGLFFAPEDYQQGTMVKLLYIHVPSAWFSLLLYGGLGFSSFVFLVTRHPIFDLFAQGFCKIGIGMTLLCIVTGALWGKPMWGTYWVWDARLTSVALLGFLYLGYWILRRHFTQTEAGARICSVLAVLGTLNLPIIKWSVTMWSTLHQGPSVFRFGGSTLDPTFLYPLLLCAGGFLFYSLVCLSLFIQTEINRKCKI